MFQIDLVTTAVVAVGFIIWLARLEFQIQSSKTENKSLRDRIKELEDDHEVELQRVRDAHTLKDRTIWEKIDSLQGQVNTSIGNVLQSIGRLEGKLESRN
jgi:hypothetical protein